MHILVTTARERNSFLKFLSYVAIQTQSETKRYPSLVQEIEPLRLEKTIARIFGIPLRTEAKLSILS